MSDDDDIDSARRDKPEMPRKPYLTRGMLMSRRDVLEHFDSTDRMLQVWVGRGLLPLRFGKGLYFLSDHVIDLMIKHAAEGDGE